SAIAGLPGLGGPADLLAVLLLEANACRLAVLGIGNRDLAYRHRSFGTVDAALRAGLRRLAVTSGDIHPLHHDFPDTGHNLFHGTAAALVLAGQDNNGVALLHPRGGHHSTSGASEIIFMNPRPRSSRTTGPKIRVPIGSAFLFTSTAALPSKRITL